MNSSILQTTGVDRSVVYSSCTNLIAKVPREPLHCPARNAVYAEVRLPTIPRGLAAVGTWLPQVIFFCDIMN